MSRYYDIVKLREGEGIVLGKDSVTVNLDKVTPQDIIQNDDEFHAGLHPENYFYVSGGGSFLLRGRYLLTVQRPLTARVNPGKLSVFSGRAEGALEWREPWRVVRELFEEVVLLEGRKIFYPRFLPYQQAIDEVYRLNFNDRYAREYEFVDLNLGEISLGAGVVRVLSEGVGNEYQLFTHINSKNDINVLSLFSININPDLLRVFDNEELNLDRVIFLLDIETGFVREVGSNHFGQWQMTSRKDMTEHLCAMLDSLAPKRVGKIAPGLMVS